MTIIRYGDGLEVPYTESSGTFTAPAGYHDNLVHNGAGTWTLTTTKQWVYEFDSNGRLVTVTDRNGNVTTISRNGSGKPTSISDGTGRALEFTYNVAGLIETITDPMLPKGSLL